MVARSISGHISRARRRLMSRISGTGRLRGLDRGIMKSGRRMILARHHHSTIIAQSERNVFIGRLGFRLWPGRQSARSEKVVDSFGRSR